MTGPNPRMAGSLTLANNAIYAFGGSAFTASGGIILSGSNVVTFDTVPAAGTIAILKYTGSTLTGAVNFSTSQARAKKHGLCVGVKRRTNEPMSHFAG